MHFKLFQTMFFQLFFNSFGWENFPHIYLHYTLYRKVEMRRVSADIYCAYLFIASH